MSYPAILPQFHLTRPRKGSWFQVFRPFDYEWNTVRLEIPGLPQALHGFRIIHLTDLHLRSRWHTAYDRLLAQIRDARADLLLYTGDFVDDKRNHLPAIPNVMRMAAGFESRLGTYAILGNHDQLAFGPRLRETPVRLISGEQQVLPVGDAAIELIGLPGAYRKHLPPEFAPSLSPPPEPETGTVRIVLSHYPDHYLRVGDILRPHLFLAGHTHGGQVCLPGGFAIIRHDRLPRRHCMGISRIDDTWMVVGRGFGSTTLPLRVFCPPEVIQIELVPVGGR